MTPDLIEGKQYLALSCGSWHLVTCRDGQLGFLGGNKATFAPLRDIKQVRELPEEA